MAVTAGVTSASVTRLLPPLYSKIGFRSPLSPPMLKPEKVQLCRELGSFCRLLYACAGATVPAVGEPVRVAVPVTGDAVRVTVAAAAVVGEAARLAVAAAPLVEAV